MSLLHQIQLNNFTIVCDIPAAFFQRITYLFLQPNVKSVGIVFDRYDFLSSLWSKA